MFLKLKTKSHTCTTAISVKHKFVNNTRTQQRNMKPYKKYFF